MKVFKKVSVMLSGILVCAIALAEVTQTQVVNFNPPIPKKPIKKGACWGASQAVPRFGAWACAAGRHSYDPCFSQTGIVNAVVCGADPVRNKPGFRLSLVQPLPAGEGVPALPGEAWKMRLEGGMVCSAVVGPQRIIQNVGRIGFICQDPELPMGVQSGLLLQLDTGDIWYGHLVHFTYAQGQYQLQGDVQQVALDMVWR